MAELASIDIGPPFTTAPVDFVPSAGRINLQANFTVGTPAPVSTTGLSVTAWVQTTIDGGLTWIDATNFTFGAVSARLIMTVFPRDSVSVPLAATDGTLAANSAPETVLGPTWRVKYAVSGVYPAGTTLRIDAV